MKRLAALLVVTAVMAGCSSWNPSTWNWNPFGSDRPAPKELQPIVAPITAASVWKESIGSVEFPLVPIVNGGIVTLASSDGNVVALEAASGRSVWRANVGAKLSAGVGSDGKVAAVVTRGGDLIALEAGQIKWKRALGARVATAPLVAGGRIFVLAVDRAVQAFDAADGAKLWQVQRPGDALTLAQEGVVAAFKDTLVVGQGPRMAGIEPNAGAIRWEVAVGAPRGANEVERLADLVGPPVRTGDLLCTRSFQAAVGCVDADRGRILWTKAIGGTDAVGGDSELLFGADASDRITAWKTPSGDVAWTSEAVMNRGVGAPGVVGRSVVFGDREGNLHWFSRDKGETQLRSTTDGNPIAVPPIVVGGTLIVVTRAGGVFAFRPA